MLQAAAKSSKIRCRRSAIKIKFARLTSENATQSSFVPSSGVNRGKQMAIKCNYNGDKEVCTPSVAAEKFKTTETAHKSSLSGEPM